MYQLEFKKQALEQVKAIAQNKKLTKKLQEILDDIIANPYSPNFKFERLKYNLSGYYSKRLTQKDRIIYQVEDEIVTVLILSVIGHYGDK